MYWNLIVSLAVGAALVTGCSDSSQISADLQNDLALASAGADLELASRSTDQMSIVGAVERTTPPSRQVASSARAPRPRRSPTPRVLADMQPEIEIVEEPEMAAADEPQPAPTTTEEAPIEVAATTRPRAMDPVSSGGAGPGTRGTDWGTIIGIAGTVVLRGGSVGEDRCIPPGAGRGGTVISINDRYPRGRGTGRVVMGGRTGGRQVVHTAPARPRDVSGRTGSPQSGTSMARTSRTRSTGAGPGTSAVHAQ